MLRKFWIAVVAAFFLGCVSNLFAQEGPLGTGPEGKGFQRKGRAARELRKYEREMRSEEKGFKGDRAGQFEGRGVGPWREGYGRAGWRGSWQKSRFGQGWGRRGGGRGFGGRGMEGWCPWGCRGGAGDYVARWYRGGRGMRCPRGWGDRGYGFGMGMKGHGRRFVPGDMHGWQGGMGFGPCGFYSDNPSWHWGGRGMRGPFMRGQGTRRPGMRGRGGGSGYGRRGPARWQGENPVEDDFEWDW